MVSMDEAALDDCMFVLSCTDGTTTSTMDVECFGPGGQGAIIRCFEDGGQTNTFTRLGPCDCSNPAGIAALAAPCEH
jgi:hypothetical protein